MDLDDRIAKAEARWEQQYSSEVALPRNPWGFFSYGDAPPAIGGASGPLCGLRREAKRWISSLKSCL